MADGLSSELGEIGSESILDGGVSQADLSDNAASGTKVDASFATVGTGSPVVYGLTILTGSEAAGAAAIDVQFGTPFAGTPNVSLSIAESGAAATHPGTVVDVNAGSFQFLGQDGLDYLWTAIGSGRV